MRAFSLINESGVRLLLDGTDGLFAASPTGLGITRQLTAAGISDYFFQTAFSQAAQNTIGFTLHFTTAPYARFKTVTQYLLTSKLLVLEYCPEGQTVYRREVELEYITKTELTKHIGWLSCPVSFKAKSPWYIEETVTGSGTVNITEGGQIPADVILTVTGRALTNPVITLTGGGTEFSRASLTVSLAASDRLEYSNRYSDSHVTALMSGIDTDLVSYLDTSFPVYGHRLGAFTVRVTDDNNAAPAITAVVRKYWGVI